MTFKLATDLIRLEFLLFVNSVRGRGARAKLDLGNPLLPTERNHLKSCLVMKINQSCDGCHRYYQLKNLFQLFYICYH